MTRQTSQEARYATYTLADVIRSMDLCWGADRAISIGAIAERRNVSRRAVELALNELALREYVPLVAGPTGVYLESNPKAVALYADALESRLASQMARVRALRKCAERMVREPKQETLPWAA